MKKTKKYLILTSLIFIALGLILTAAAFFSVGFHISGFNTVNYEAELTPLERPYNKIVIDADWCDVLIMKPQARSAFPQYQDLGITSPCVLSYNAGNEIFTEVGYGEGNILYITRRDLRRWYDRIGYDFDMQSDQIVLFLDDLHFDALEIQSSSGRIWLLSEAEIEQVQLQSISGEIFSKDLTCDALTIKTTSGAIHVQTSASGNLLLETTSGDITLSTVHAADTFHAKTVSGEISADMITSQNTLTLETTSGDIVFSDLDAASGLCFESTSGDIDGSISTAKRFSVKTVSGDVDVPSDVNGAPLCVVKTTSGDIDIKIK